LVAGRERFWTFIPLKEAVRAGDLEIVGHEEIPEHADAFPVLREAGAITPGGEVLNWSLWDGKRRWRIPRLTPEYEKLSIASLWDLWLLRQRIASDWSPKDGLGDHVGVESAQENVPFINGSASASDGAVLTELERVGADLNVAHPVEHLLIFGNKSASDRAGKVLQERGYAVGNAISTEEGQWILTAERPLVLGEDSIASARAELEAIARQFEGEYDGWQAGVDPLPDDANSS
jgi:regulator of RNase E activity RraB